MLKQVFRTAFVVLIWKQYKTAIISTALLFFYLYLVGSIHADYLIHARLQTPPSLLGMSFVIKWLALTAGVLLYAVFHFIRWRRSVLTVPQDTHATEENDPFAQIRQRKTLRGPEDF